MGNSRTPGPLNPAAMPLDLEDGTLPRGATPLPGPAAQAKGDTGKEAAPATPPDGGAPTPAAPPAQTLGQRVVAYAAEQEGTTFRNGECFTLVDQALRQAGAQSAADFGEVTPDADYVWGDSTIIDQVQPGDLVQFRNFVSTVTTSSATEEDSQSYDAPHHSAIVAADRGDGEVQLLEQNLPDGSPVHRTIVCLRPGTWSGDGDSTITVVTSGRYWLYRPRSRD
jgi:hypothetical protein